MPYARMRTLLNESLPPGYHDESTISSRETIERLPRTFSQNAVLSPEVADLAEVGVGGTVMATPGAENNAPARGLASSEVEELKEFPAV
jgi:hypothetical protein